MDYVENVKKYESDPNEDAIEALVAHLGIALQSKDGMMVAASDPDELAKIRDNFCSRTLDLSKEEADAAIEKVCARMKGDTAKTRVTFYYLLAVESNTMHRLAG
ncbi:MAG: DUF2853 family protein [Planctomycetota bacterium]